ncbi:MULTISPECIES: tautomerase family protein [Moraxella]|nr:MULTISPECIES: 4-oxalocrotonate tautomerase family protein [Moraxella]OAU94388.1 4-oxalocrotonate tautomerase [Moraxella catarrhalis]OAU94836.1 4-oxalocrotonate tautomerase [Moraxella catarrhalis]OAV01978.1 4-oxalocrotonate tautomerase [Moraxella catarrhalis]OAV02725.1 4-oxalocrotonate tautomerase [Moraxella catarrhalis]WQE04284.1 4-oxalocrotonate tautomerase family protein [Moraxella canis]
MPYVNVKVTGGSEAPTTEQKQQIIEGVTELLARVLNKNPATTVVVIDEVDMDNYGLGGKTITEVRKLAK